MAKYSGVSSLPATNVRDILPYIDHPRPESIPCLFIWKTPPLLLQGAFYGVYALVFVLKNSLVRYAPMFVSPDRSTTCA